MIEAISLLICLFALFYLLGKPGVSRAPDVLPSSLRKGEALKESDLNGKKKSHSSKKETKSKACFVPPPQAALSMSAKIPVSKASLAVNRLKSKKDLLIYSEIMQEPIALRKANRWQSSHL